MDRESLFETWAPHESIWSPWAKPVLFAHLGQVPLLNIVLPETNTSWAPSVVERTALVLELPGIQSVAAGLALADAGYRPVPLFNACPAIGEGDCAASELVDVTTILAGLVAGAERLRPLTLRPDAPPAFLLDAARNQPIRSRRPGMYDNRSVVFSTDFPSVGFCQAHQIQRALVVHSNGSRPLAGDLLAAIRPWQDNGLELWQKDAAGAEMQQRLQIASWNSWVWSIRSRLFALLRLRRNPLGGFGSYVAEADGGHGG
jgi:hypothetical protein